MANTRPPCAVCKGAFEEHGPGKTQHAYTEREGEMVTHEQRAKQQQQPAKPMILNMPTSNNPTQVERLIEVLLAKHVLDVPEALYILGVGTKPEPTSGYVDPIARM